MKAFGILAARQHGNEKVLGARHRSQPLKLAYLAAPYLFEVAARGPRVSNPSFDQHLSSFRISGLQQTRPPMIAIWADQEILVRRVVGEK
jgi:hypothetical protein